MVRRERATHPGRVKGTRKVHVARRPYGGSGGRSTPTAAEAPVDGSASNPARPDEPLGLELSAGGAGVWLLNSREPEPNVIDT